MAMHILAGETGLRVSARASADISIFDFPSRAAWVTMALIVVFNHLALAMLGIPVGLEMLPWLAGAAALMMAIANFYTHHRPDRNLANGAMTTVFIIGVAVSVGTLQYPMTAVGGPVQDVTFMELERWLGFDWAAWAVWLSNTKELQIMWLLAYSSSGFQIAIAVIALVFTGRNERAGAFLGMFLFGLLACDILSALIPAEGPITSYRLAPEIARVLGEAGVVQVPIFRALRDGTFDVLVLGKLTGMITFPSFHCVLAVISTWVFWSVRYVRWLALVLNGLVIAATIPQGGHYLADILAGILIGVGCVVWLRPKVT